MQAIVFDFGNVIAHFDHRRAFTPLAKHTSLTVDEMLQCVIECELEDDYESGRIEEDAFLQEVKQRCQLTCELPEIRYQLAEIFWLNESLAELIPQLAEHYPLYLLSNTNLTHARRFREQFSHTLQHFQQLFLSYELGIMKPDCEIFNKVQSAINLPAKELLFIDDLAANVEAAKSCGWQGIVFQGTDDLQQQLNQLGISLTTRRGNR